jgi:Fe-S-cluster containining protein
MGSSICDICSNKCFGIEGYDGSCCSIEDRDYIIGPIRDTDEFLVRLKNHLGRDILWEDVFVNYETGSQMFPERSNWQMEENYPAMRINFSHQKLPCIFYNTQLKFCTVHSIRPQTCQDYFCDFLSDAIEPKTGKGLEDTFKL